MQMTFDEQIAALKRQLSVKTDMALAESLGLQRFAVAKWRARGVLPDKYLSLLIDISPEGAREAMTKALKIQAFGRIEAAYWLRAALAVLPPDALADQGETPHERGRRLERLVLHLMNAAYDATYMAHGRELCRDDAECDAVIDILVSEKAGRVAAILGGVVATSESSPPPDGDDQ